MKLYTCIISFFLLASNQAFSQEITVKGMINNLPDSIKFINFSTGSGYYYKEINQGKFDFKIDYYYGKDKLNKAYFVLSKSEFPTF